MAAASEPSREAKVKLDAAFTDLYRSHLRDVYSYSYYRVGNHHDAEDLTEQTFLQAYRHFERAVDESDGRPLRPWLIRIAHNLAANLYRDRSRKPQTNIDDTDTLRTIHTTEDLVGGSGSAGKLADREPGRHTVRTARPVWRPEVSHRRGTRSTRQAIRRRSGAREKNHRGRSRG